jgi:hypothetical protein
MGRVATDFGGWVALLAVVDLPNIYI